MDRAKYIEIRNSLNLEKTPFALTLHLFQSALMLAGAVLLWRYFSASWLRFTAIPCVFSGIFRGFGIMHDAVHGAVSKNRWVNSFAGIFGGSLCLLPYEPWKKSHLHHHHWSGNVEKDPVMALIIVYPKMPKAMKVAISALWMAWFPILGFLQHVVFWKLSVSHYVKEPKNFKTLVSLAAPVMMWGALFAFIPGVFLLEVLLPSLFLYFVGIEVVNLPHHLQLPQYRGDTKFTAWEQYKTARSCIYPKWFARFVVLNFNYHVEHHMFPDVPWYHLDKLHLPVKAALQGQLNTDSYFSWILENKTKAVGQVLSPENDDKVQPPVSNTNSAA